MNFQKIAAYRDYEIDSDGMIYVMVHGRKWTMRQIVDWWSARGMYAVVGSLCEDWVAMMMAHLDVLPAHDDEIVVGVLNLPDIERWTPNRTRRRA